MKSIMKWFIENKELIGFVVLLVVSVSLAAYIFITDPAGFLEGLIWYFIWCFIWHKVHK